jgi:sugar transferase (PEP-CTERM/EpsH1 system associated)|tara:strand:- start:1152 stop:2330 length:1179 start_codon:yes stop_codon:yes gene_type:complete
VNILFIANRFPYPPFRGDKLKIYNLTKRLAAKHDLYLVTFYESRDELNYLKDIQPFFKEIELVYLPKWRSILNGIPALFSHTPLQVAYFKSSKMKRMVKLAMDRYDIDVVHTQHLRMSQYTKYLDVPKILDLPDAFSLYFKRRNETDRPFINRLIDTIEIGRLTRAEKVITTYDKTLVCSVEDQKYLEQLHNTNNIDILLNGVDLSTFDVGRGHDYSHNKTLLFTGNMDYAPNVDAVQYFVKEMWPAISEANPTTKFIIAGQRPVDAVKKLVTDRIGVTGFVPDLKDIYAEASVVIAPLRFGAGTQNKVLEAMAMGVPTVCTHIGFKGLQIQSGQGVIMAKEKSQFIQEVNMLLSDTAKRQSVGEQGLEIAQTRFSWDQIALQLEKYLQEIA